MKLTLFWIDLRKRRPKARFQDGAPVDQHGAHTFDPLLLGSIWHCMEFHRELETKMAPNTWVLMQRKQASKLKHHEVLAATKKLSEFRAILGSGANICSNVVVRRVMTSHE